MFVQSIDIALAELYRITHHKLYMSQMEGKNYLQLEHETCLWICSIGGLLKLHRA